MNNGSENTFLIILALIAVFILLQLRRTLGKKTGYDNSDKQQDIYERNAHPSEKDASYEKDDNVISLHPDQEEAGEKPNLGLSPTSPFYGAIEKIHAHDRSFSLRSFIDGAEQAYGIILNSFWQADKKTLRSMLSKEVFEQFSNSVDQLKDKKLQWENTIKDVEMIDLEEANITGSLAEVTLKFTSHMVLSSKDMDGNIVEGDAKRPVKVTDIWTFCRDVRSSDPNWTLVATRNA